MWNIKIKSALSIHKQFFSKSNITSDLKRKIEIKLFIQSAFASGSRLMGIIHIHLIIYLLECTTVPKLSTGYISYHDMAFKSYLQKS